MKIQYFWEIRPCRLANTDVSMYCSAFIFNGVVMGPNKTLLRLLDHEEKHATILLNVRDYLPVSTVLYS
jgi:hypothetical protein